MNVRIEINVYYFPVVPHDDLDEVRDIRSYLGGFTWRREGQVVPSQCQAVRRNVSFENPSDIYDLAESIRNHFPFDVNRGESFRIATALYNKVNFAKRKMGTDVQYIHSEGYAPADQQQELVHAGE